MTTTMTKVDGNDNDNTTLSSWLAGEIEDAAMRLSSPACACAHVPEPRTISTAGSQCSRRAGTVGKAIR
jgi:hypothetical protein